MQSAKLVLSSEDETEKTLVITVDHGQSSTRSSGRRKGCLKRKREMSGTAEAGGQQEEDEEDEDEIQPEVEIDQELDRELENKSRQHNLTSANVRNIIHEVITNEHVVAMMKAAINDTEPVPLFEPKMTRSKLKEVVEKGVIKYQNFFLKGPQFVDIPLEEEDSSDEEYHPDEEEDDETAEDVNLHRARHLRVEVVPMGPPPPPQGPEPPGPPKECSFMEKLYAVDEELAIGSDCIDTYQSLSSNGEDSLMAFRTRSKRPLRDVPLEDREWTQWLQGLMCSDEADDDDDPEYNFLADLDEPDVEDYRNDKAVRIPKKEVNDLMEELFDAFQDELGGQDEEGHEDEDEKEEDDTTQQEPSSILETLEYEDPLADIRKQRFRTVKEQLAAIRKRKAFLESKGVFIPPPAPKCPTSPSGPMLLTHSQKLHLQQHIQQHVQLLTQVNMLSRSVKPLQTEACTARQFLLELQFFAQQGEKARSEVEPGFVSIFRACNLQAAISLLEELDNSPKTDPQPHGPLFPGTQIPAHLAWLMATRPVFLYPELLPRVDLSTFHYKGPFTSAENCLVVLGHKHFQGTLHPLQLACQYLLVARNLVCLTSHMRFFFQKESPSILKNYFLDGVYPSMPLACERVSPGDMCPPVERERRLMPYWLSENLQLIKDEVRKFNPQLHSSQPAQPEDTTLAPSTISAISEPASPSCAFTSNTQYPPWLPETLAESLKPRPPGSRRKKNSDLSAQTVTEPSKPSPPPKEVVEALSRLPLIAPKNPCSSVNTFIYPANQANPPCNKKSKTNPPSSRTVTRKRNGEIQTEPTNLNLPSLGDVAVKTTEIHSAGSSTAELTLPGPNQANVIILPATSAATAFICPTPINKLMTQTPVSFTQLAKDHISQRCGTLLRLSTGPRIPLGMNPPKPLSLPQNTLHQFLILPPGCIVTNSANLNQKPVTAHDQTPPLTQDSMTMESVTQSSLGNISEGMQDFNADLQNSKSNKALEGSSALNKVIEEEELDEVEMLGNEGDPEEYEEEDFRKPFLTLSESSGSPTPSLSGDDVAMVTVMAEDEREQRQPSTEGERSVEVLERKTEGEHSGKVTSPASETSVLSLPELKETIEKLSRLASEPSSEDKGLSEELQSEEALLYDDFSDDDPQKDSKDVAFAQAYLEKACEVLQVVPGKVEEFLGVLYEFERDPEGRTSVELFKRLKPVLKDWPELLSDFAAFLHPEQANECGLLSEQQAFERSRRFLRQLELTFGEHSVHYRRVVRTLQQGPSKSLSGLKEMKTQLAMLFRDHPHLLEEYWVFFERLHSTVQCRSDDAEEVEEEDLDCDDSDSVSDIVTQDAEYHVAGPEVEDENSKERDTQFCLQIPKSPVCAKNSSRMPSGEKVVLWTREADRVILTTCQQRGASQSTFSFIAAQLGNKTATEV
uniref:Si:dkey-27c15.3 n=1 Tax=Astyanax mexicanus TaxID=7994 RepID=A0A8B9JLD5_ASTMX